MKCLNKDEGPIGAAFGELHWGSSPQRNHFGLRFQLHVQWVDSYANLPSHSSDILRRGQCVLQQPWRLNREMFSFAVALCLVYFVRAVSSYCAASTDRTCSHMARTPTSAEELLGEFERMAKVFGNLAGILVA